MASPDTIYSLTMKNIDGMDVPFSQYQGKVLLIVNTASKGRNKKKLMEIQRIHERFRGRPFEVLAFPCNQFFWQEKKSNDKIKEKYRNKMGLTFQIFERSDVNGSHANLVYNWLKRKEKGVLGSMIEDNFVKFLVDSDGLNVHRFNSMTSMKDVEDYIEKALKKVEGRLDVPPAALPPVAVKVEEHPYQDIQPQPFVQ